MQALHDLPHATPTTAVAARWRGLVVGVAAAVIGMAAFLAGVLALVNRLDWWRGYAAASIAVALADGASLVPLVWGLHRGPAAMVQMFMASTATRAAVAIGLCALAVGIGHYPAVPTFALLLPYYLALLAVETVCLARGRTSNGQGVNK